MSNAKFFEKNKHCLVKNVLSKDFLEIATQYTLFDEDLRFMPEDFSQQVPGAHSKYSDLLMESTLLYLLPVIEKNTGLSLYPTYSYYRVYRPGDLLEPHTDRYSCEISATLFIGKNYEEESWPIFVENKSFTLEPGDMLIYRGIELSHYRNLWESDSDSFHSQVFLHYVDKNGPYKNFKYDERSFLGMKNH
jgi:hypothetical protein